MCTQGSFYFILFLSTTEGGFRETRPTNDRSIGTRDLKAGGIVVRDGTVGERGRGATREGHESGGGLYTLQATGPCNGVGLSVRRAVGIAVGVGEGEGEEQYWTAEGRYEHVFLVKGVGGVTRKRRWGVADLVFFCGISSFLMFLCLGGGRSFYWGGENDCRRKAWGGGKHS